jgi:hypothetical protein
VAQHSEDGRLLAAVRGKIAAKSTQLAKARPVDSSARA